MGRRIWYVGLVGGVLLLAAGLVGYRVGPQEQDPLHIGLALATSLLVVLSQGWFVLYLALTHRLIRARVRELGADAGALGTSRRLLALTLPPALASLGGALVLVILGARLITGHGSPQVHHGFFWLTLAATAWALWAERTTARRHEELVRELDRSGR